MTTHQTLREANLARQAEWAGPVKLSLAYKANELFGEAGEACNVIKKLERERLGVAGSRATKQDLADELADVVICVDLLAIEAGLPPIMSKEEGLAIFDLCSGGNLLGATVGEVCNAADAKDVEWLEEALEAVDNALELLARKAGIDLIEAVSAKFNATSVKVGLETRLAA